MVGWLAAGIACTVYFMAIVSWVGFGDKFHAVWLLMGVACFGAAAYVRYARQHEYHMPQPLRYGMLGVCTVGILCLVVLEGMIISGSNATPEPEADYVLVLGAQVRGDTPSWELRSRLNTAARYLADNPESKAILSGGQGAGENVTEAEAMYKYLVAQGIDESRLIPEGNSTTTQENIAFSKEKMETQDASLVIVTSGFHVYRAMRMAEKQGLHDVSGYGSPCKKQMIPTYYLREALAMVKAWLRGDI